MIFYNCLKKFWFSFHLVSTTECSRLLVFIFLQLVFQPNDHSLDIWVSLVALNQRHLQKWKTRKQMKNKKQKRCHLVTSDKKMPPENTSSDPFFCRINYYSKTAKHKNERNTKKKKKIHFKFVFSLKSEYLCFHKWWNHGCPTLWFFKLPALRKRPEFGNLLDTCGSNQMTNTNPNPKFPSEFWGVEKWIRQWSTRRGREMNSKRRTNNTQASKPCISLHSSFGPEFDSSCSCSCVPSSLSCLEACWRTCMCCCSSWFWILSFQLTLWGTVQGWTPSILSWKQRQKFDSNQTTCKLEIEIQDLYVWVGFCEITQHFHFYWCKRGSDGGTSKIPRSRWGRWKKWILERRNVKTDWKEMCPGIVLLCVTHLGKLIGLKLQVMGLTLQDPSCVMPSNLIWPHKRQTILEDSMRVLHYSCCS